MNIMFIEVVTIVTSVLLAGTFCFLLWLWLLNKEQWYNNSMKNLNHAIPYKDGEISIQASQHHYCIPKQDEGPYSAFEIAVFNRKGERVVEDAFKGHEDGDDAPVYGFVPVTKLIMALKEDGYSDLNMVGILERLGN